MSFPDAARISLADTQLRANLTRATTTIRDKRAGVVAELPDWEELRTAGAEAKQRALLGLDGELERLERAVADAGGQVHWASDGPEACAIVAEIASSHSFGELVKVRVDRCGEDRLERLERSILDVSGGKPDARAGHLLFRELRQAIHGPVRREKPLGA